MLHPIEDPPVPRADAQRNVDALLAAAKEEFAAQGVDHSARHAMCSFGSDPS